MENSAGKSGGAENSRKNRSLDLQSLYKSRISKKEATNKSSNDVVDDGEVRKKKRKSRKEVLLSSFEPADKKNRSSLAEDFVDGASSDLPDLDKSRSGPSQKSDSGGRFGSISLNLEGSGDVLRIPKRRRDFVGRRKVDSNQVSRSSATSSSKAGDSVDQSAKLNGECRDFEHTQVLKPSESLGGKDTSTNQIAELDGDSAGKIVSPTVKEKTGFDHLKENKTRMANSTQCGSDEDGHLIVNNGDASSRKRLWSHRKRKNLATRKVSQNKKVVPLAVTSVELCDDSLDEDEENLEQNAARMLSSRFDPSCTRFPSKSRSSASPTTNGFPRFVPSGHDFVNRGASGLAGLDSVSVDSANRVLRPRKQYKEKSLLRKRRHFYEILSGDFDAYWVLNRRIKVFWPLDASWYHGLVNDYDPERKLHHIKYDDRDEEWINLQTERFKLLLFLHEVPGKVEASTMMEDMDDDKGKREMTSDDDSLTGSYKDTEPIISWLARSSRRVKSSSVDVSKRHKAFHPSPNFIPLVLSAKTDDASGCLDVGSSERDMSKPSTQSSLLDGFTDTRMGDKSVGEGNSCSKDSKIPVVYFRRRFRKKRVFNAHQDSNACESNPVSVSSPLRIHGSSASTVYDISPGEMESEGLLWSLDNAGLLRLNITLFESEHLRLVFGHPIPVPWYRFGVQNSWLLHAVSLLHHGTIMSRWPKVHLEMLFVDNFVGLRFLMFEGCLKQAVAFIFLVLTVFYQPNEGGKYADMQMPVTSIRFKLSCTEDLRKQHVFAFYSFFKVKHSKWLYLDCKLQPHCMLAKQLALSECTYDNIKALEGGSNQLHQSSSNKGLSAFEGLRKMSVQGTMHNGAFRESCGVAIAQCSSNSDAKHEKFPAIALSFDAAPTFFLSLHLKLLMENSVACISLRDHDWECALEHSEDLRCPVVRDCAESVLKITPDGNLKTYLGEGEASGLLPCPISKLRSDSISASNHVFLSKSSKSLQNGNLKAIGSSAFLRDAGEDKTKVIVQSEKPACNILESEPLITPPESLVPEDHTSSGMSDSRCRSNLNGLSVEIPSLDQVERPANGKTPSSVRSADLAWNTSHNMVHSPNPTGLRSMWHRTRTSSSSLYGNTSHLWPNGKADLMCNGFGNGPKKPRTQVQYTLPFGDFDSGSKQKIQNQRGLPYKRIRKTNDKRTLDGCRSSYRNLELLVCDANVLITNGDRGWREHGARVALELADHNEWRIVVKVSGTTKYSYKAHQFLQPGSTNRYTHAMMWKGGKDWVLEFPDRSQWGLFKEMHEECYNRNIRAASVKNIPIPGVRLVEESDDNGREVPFIRSCPKYIRQVETDVDMAMNPSHILYDMDSDDEQWISENQRSSQSDGSKCEEEISKELFEKTMDMFEKIAFAQQRDHFTSDDMEKLMVGVAPMEVIKVIHEHWRLKRQTKGMPLIRHLQPPLWERYEQQVKEWERSIAKANTALSNECQERAPAMEKPPMFAFCLKPRGLEVPNKGSKQRSQRKFTISGHSHAVLGDQDGLHAFARRSNGFAYGDEKLMFHGNGHESSELSPFFQTSTRAFSPRDPSASAYFSMNSDLSEWNHYPKLHRNKSKKIGTLLSPNNPQMVASYNQRPIGKRNGVQRWNMGLPEWPSQKHYQPDILSMRHDIEQLDGSDLDEFRLRDASSAAQHARNMAKLKRENAQRLLYRADLAIHKAVVALMTAEAMKATSSSLSSFSEDANGDNR